MTKRLTEHEKLYRQLQRQSKKANQRLRELHKEYESETWAEKNLYSKIGVKGATKTGLVKVSKKMTEAELRRQLKATESFLNDKRSTVKGLEETKQKLQESISSELQTDYKISTEEADNLVQLFQEENFKEMTKYMSPSEIWALIREAKENNVKSKKQFVDMFRNYIEFSENKGIVKTLEKFYKYNYRKI